MMRYLSALFVASTVRSALAQADAQGRYTLQAEGIKAQFIPYGATLTNLFVKGKGQLGCANYILTISCRQERRRA